MVAGSIIGGKKPSQFVSVTNGSKEELEKHERELYQLRNNVQT
jgi:hypothetical protein